MSNNKQKETDTEMNENSVNNYKIVFDDENKQDVKTKPKKPKKTDHFLYPRGWLWLLRWKAC